MRALGSGLGVVVLMVMAACIPEAQLQPRPDARSLAGDTSAAVAETAGVRLIADGAAWKGHPGNLERRLTPVKVFLENRSGRTLSIRPGLFALVGESRFQYAALSPQEQVHEGGPVCTAGYMPMYSWGVYAGWGPFIGWPRHAPWHTWWPGPYSYWDPFYGPWYGPPPYVRCEEPLPTKDMRARALPEGTLENGGTVAGFLYFPKVTDRERQVLLQAQLVDANTGEALGVVRIPFEVHRD